MSEATPSKGMANGRWLPMRRPTLWVIVLLVMSGIFSVGGLVLRRFTMGAVSMEPTLLVGDRLLVKKFNFSGRSAIGRSDLVVFRLPVQNHPPYIKRAVGVPGDRIKIVNGKVHVNDKPLDEPYVMHDPMAYDPFGANFPPTEPFNLQGAAVLPEWAAHLPSYVKNGELVVPPGHYFVLGDNREHSWDSRYWGFVDRDAIIGRPVVIYWSGTSAGVRWERMLHAVH